VLNEEAASLQQLVEFVEAADLLSFTDEEPVT
jgi:hypothetical protein